jgi:uncharacterized membrane protein
MFVAALFISGRGWLMPAVILLGLALLIVFWAYYRAPAGGGVRILGSFLKLLGVLALLACLLEPLWSGQRARPGANFFALVGDNSQGMQIKDRGEPRSRGEFLRTILAVDKGNWQSKLEENFQVRRYLFDSRLQSTKDFGELAFDGRASSIGAALKTVSERYHGQPLAGVLLFTDGNATDMPDGSADLAGLPPIYPVVIGSDAPITDIAVNNVTVSQTSFEDAPVSVQADVTAVGYAGANIVAQLIEAGQAGSGHQQSGRQAATNSTARISPEKIVAEQTLKAPGDGQILPFRFQIRPEKTGVLFYRLRVSAKSELDQFSKPEQSTEATLANNSRVLAVDRGNGPYRLLYVAGRPNWEYKFLHRAIEADEQIELVGLIRIAKREPKFEFRGRAGESSNPLFRGFGNQSKEEIERYDQPVLQRLNTRDEYELRGGFPKTAEELYAYQAVILDDLEAEFFTPDQMTLLQKFVSERGGGFLMLGGAESFQQGKYNRTPIGDMLPVYLDLVGENKPPGDSRLSLTRDGWLQPWARLRNNESDEKTRLASMPPFLIMNQVRGFKPGASVIATLADARANQYPALVVQRFGNGRTAALTIGDLWHWGFRDKDVHRDMDKAWRQMLRWLVAVVPNRIDLQTEPKRGDPNQAVLLQVRARDKKFQPLDNATVTVTVLPVDQDVRSLGTNGQPWPQGAAGTNLIRLTAEPALSEAGLYQTTYVPREAGGYHAEAVVTDATGLEVGRSEAGWTSNPAAEEFRSLKPNRALLETIAKRTGGEMIAANKLEDFARGLPSRKVPITENWTFPLWHRSAVFLFALGCFVAEWGLRRWKGLV